MVNILVEHTDTVGTATNSGDIYFSIYLPCCYFYDPKIPSHLPITLIFDELKKDIKLHQKGVKHQDSCFRNWEPCILSVPSFMHTNNTLLRVKKMQIIYLCASRVKLDLPVVYYAVLSLESVDSYSCMCEHREP